MAHHLAPEAVRDLDEIWFYVATESGSIDTADRLIDSITKRFLLLSLYPHIGRLRDHDLRVGLRSFPVADYVIFYRAQGGDVLIQRVIRGSRDLEGLLYG